MYIKKPIGTQRAPIAAYQCRRTNQHVVQDKQRQTTKKYQNKTRDRTRSRSDTVVRFVYSSVVYLMFKMLF